MVRTQPFFTWLRSDIVFRIFIAFLVIFSTDTVQTNSYHLEPRDKSKIQIIQTLSETLKLGII